MKQTKWYAISGFFPPLREHNGFETTIVDELLQVLHRGTPNSSISFYLYCKTKNWVYWDNKKVNEMFEKSHPIITNNKIKPIAALLLL